MRSGLNEAVAKRDHDRLGAVYGAEFLAGIGGMGLRRPLADLENFPNLRGGLSEGCPRQDLPLTRGQVRSSVLKRAMQFEHTVEGKKRHEINGRQCAVRQVERPTANPHMTLSTRGGDDGDNKAVQQAEVDRA